MANAFRSLSPDLLNVPRGRAAIRMPGRAGQPIGDVTLNWNNTSDLTEFRTNEEPDRPIIATDANNTTGTFSIVCRQVPDLIRALSFGSTGDEVWVQPAANNATMTVPTEAGVHNLNVGGQHYVRITAGSVSIADADDPLRTLEEGDDFAVDYVSGQVQIHQIPAGFSEDGLIITFDAAAIQASAKQKVFSLLQNAMIRGELTVRQVNKRGTNHLIVIPICEFRLNGETALITDSNDAAAVTLEGKIISDPTQPVGKRRGWAIPLND